MRLRSSTQDTSDSGKSDTGGMSTLRVGDRVMRTSAPGMDTCFGVRMTSAGSGKATLLDVRTMRNRQSASVGVNALGTVQSLVKNGQCVFIS